MWKKFVFIIISCFLLILFTLQAQDINPPASNQDSLVSLYKNIWKCKDDSTRIAANSLFFNRFVTILSNPAAFSYPFDSLKGISRLKSEDGKFRITTWNIPLNNGTYTYWGFLEVDDGSLHELRGKQAYLTEWQNKILSVDKWNGAIYYKLIKVSHKKVDYYTLLGWDGNNDKSNLKIIEVLTFPPDGTPVFGSPVFKTREGLKNRVIIEYAEKANALLRYDYQGLLVQKGKRVKEVKTWMVVTDRLIPMDPSFEGLRKYYVPAGDTYDAYIFKDGFWTFVEDVKVANPSPGSKIIP